MPTSKNLPKHAVRVSTYHEFRQYGRAFAAGNLNFLLVIGSGGVGKSTTFRNAAGTSAHWIEGNATPFGIYQEAYQHRNRALVLDDVDALYRDRNGVRLLKALCQQEQERAVCWYSEASVLEQRNIPRRFTTRSQVAILANDWCGSNKDVTALEDRAHVVLFDPSPLEVHRDAANWFADQEIFSFIGQHLHLVKQHSLRLYRRAWELKQADLDWRKMILSALLEGKPLLVAQLKADQSYASEEERVQAFTASGAGCRATYFNHAKKLVSTVASPQMVLAQALPPRESDAEQSFMSDLEEQFGRLGYG